MVIDDVKDLVEWKLYVGGDEGLLKYLENPTDRAQPAWQVSPNPDEARIVQRLRRGKDHYTKCHQVVPKRRKGQANY